MPYTPPSQLSPATSTPTSPAPNRSQSFLQSQRLGPESPPAVRQALPRSTGSSSYLSRHRRSPSASKIDEPSLTQTGVDVRDYANVNGQAYESHGRIDPYGSLRQSPPPKSHLTIPSGATMSPPESAHTSSDEDDTTRSRGRDLENLAELQAAIRIIEQRKEGSPSRHDDDENKRIRLALESIPAATRDLFNAADSARPPLSREARKISHSRSSTDSNIVFDHAHQIQSPTHSPQDDEEDDDDDSDDTRRSRPTMVRKKSGELVRPALRPSSKRRPSSMPGTPTYSKAVHFDSHLEHVRHFLQVDRPLAVSAGSSPVEAYEGEMEFPFGDADDTRSRAPSCEWEIRLANFPAENEARRAMIVRVERVYLSSDNKNLIGAIAVQNLAFQKLVVARFTLDYWKTTSEVVADFNNDVRRKQVNDGCDRFTFSIKLADQANLENKTMFFCIRYNVQGQEYWDSNNGMNYQVDFSKKLKSQKTKEGQAGLGARPVSNIPRSRTSPSISQNGRPQSMHSLGTSFDDFSSGFENFGTFGQSAASIMGDTPLKLKAPRARQGFLPDAPARRPKSNGQAFGNRYDFGASLNAAIQNASAILGDQSGLTFKSDAKQSSREVPAGTATKEVAPAGPTSTAPALAATAPKPAALVSEKPALQSQSYQELVDKYCFFGSSRVSPQLTNSVIGMVDGASDDHSVSSLGAESPSTEGSRTPTPPRSMSPSPPMEQSSVVTFTPPISRSNSPMPRTGSAMGSRSESPASFGYPYHQSSTLLNEHLAPAAIRG